MIDIKALLLSNILVSAFFCIAFFLYSLNQKTYRGFRLWIFSILIMIFGFLAIILRGTISTELSVFVVNGFFILAAVTRLDAIRRFIIDKGLHALFYTIPIFVIFASSIFYFSFDRIDVRTSIVSVVLFILSVSISWILVRRSTPENRILYYSAAIFIGVRGLIILSRAFLWQPNDLLNIFDASIWSTIQLEFGLISEIGQNVIFLMMNSHRASADFIQTESRLNSTINDLKKANVQIKTLEGIIPICMHCKKIRDGEKVWNQLEQYISDHSEAEFSHGICPDCIQQYYPQYMEKSEGEPAKKNSNGLIRLGA